MHRFLARAGARSTFVRSVLRRRMAQIGIFLVSINIAMAVFAPYLTPYDPIRDYQVADDYALPSWMAFFPGFSDLPRNILFEVNAAKWAFSVSGEKAKAIDVASSSPFLVITYSSIGVESGEGKASLRFSFDYRNSPPNTFIIRVPYNVSEVSPGVSYRLSVSLKTPSAKQFTLLDTFPWRTLKINRWGENQVIIHSRDIQVATRAGVSIFDNVARQLFSQRGTYQLYVDIFFRDEASGRPETSQMSIGKVVLSIPGLLHGPLGTNKFGADIFAQFVYGARASLMVGVISVSLIVSLGLVFGIIAGYRGGRVDRGLVFIADTLLQIPGLPIILLVLLFLGRSLFTIIAILALLSWSGLARQIRSWVLSLRERAFVEAARAAGASDLYLMFRVIAPHTMPIVAVAVALGIPGAIFAEAGISILGFGDPLFPSWGKIINEALFLGGIAKWAWWWIAPPIIGILSLAMGFVFVGFTLDELLNPRLRRTR